MELDDFVGLGFARATVSANISAKRPSWRGIVSMPDPSDSRRTLYAFASLPSDKQAQVKSLTNGEEPVAFLLAREQFAVLRQLLPQVPKRDVELLRQYRIERETADTNTGEVKVKTISGLPEDKFAAYGLACRWLSLLSDPRWKKKAERVKVNPAFESMQAFQDACITVFNTDGVKLPSNYSKLQGKLRDYKAQGVLCLVSKAFGNTNTLKIDDEQLDYLIKLYSDSKKPTFEQVTGWYNEAAITRAKLGLTMWPEITSGTTKKRLLAPDIQPNWYMGRHGFDAWKSKFEYTMLCYKPSQRDVQWVIDGTKVNKRYRTAKGVSAKLKMLAVMDVASELFLGWAFSETEDAREVAKAVRMAIRRSGGATPFQFLYDNDSSNTAFFKNMAGLHFPAMPYNGQSKTIEGAFGRLQKTIMRADKNFTGQNITAKSLNSRENMDGMKLNDLPTLAECMAQAELELHTWNNLPGKDGKSPKQRYEGTVNPHPTFLSPEDEMEAFWLWNDTTISYRKDGLRFRKHGTETVFEVVNEVATDIPGVTRAVPDLDFHSAFVGQNFWVKYDPENPADKIALFVGTDKRFIGFAHAKRAMPRAVADYKAGDRSAIQVRLQTKKDQAHRVLHKAEDIAERFDAEELLKFGQHRYWSKDVETAAEDDFLAAQEVAKAPKRMPARAAEPITHSTGGHSKKADFLKGISFND